MAVVIVKHAFEIIHLLTGDVWLVVVVVIVIVSGRSSGRGFPKK